MKKSQKAYLVLKRFISICGAFVGILFCLGLFWWWVFIINLIVTKGHPFFMHERVGKDGKPFKMIKFRSMYLSADPNSTSEFADHSNMVTPFGKFLRATSLDETPQLFNILVGSMAFIGPRPVINHHEDKLTIELRKQNGAIHLKPGLSGYAQVHGRVNVSPEEKGKMDGYYYEHISLWLDIKLFCQTIACVFTRHNTEKDKKED
ncbi:MAG: sugar transferase [archaeon]|nr:sugar transferase [archaeon]